MATANVLQAMHHMGSWQVFPILFACLLSLGIIQSQWQYLAEPANEDLIARTMEYVDECHKCCQEIKGHEHGQEVENLLCWADSFIVHVCQDLAEYRESPAPETARNVRISLGNLMATMEALREALLREQA